MHATRLSQDQLPDTKLPIVAVVTPVYNGAKYLAATLACVQRQTYANVIHIVLDNASTDATPAIIESFRDGPVPLIVSRNAEVLPQQDNWNAVMRLVPAEAAYVQWLCADDLIRRDAIEKLVAKAQSDPDIVCVGATDVVHDRTMPTHLPNGQTVENGHSFIQRVCRSEEGHFAWPAFFIRWRSSWAERPFFLPGAPSFDCEAVLRVAAEGKVGHVPEPLIYSRHHAENYGRQLYAKSGIPHFWKLEAALRHGGAWPQHQAKRTQQIAKTVLVRKALSRQLRGSGAAAAEMQMRAKAIGAPFRAIDYAMAVVTFPWYFLRTRWIRTIATPESGKVITEEEFVAF